MMKSKKTPKFGFDSVVSTKVKSLSSRDWTIIYLIIERFQSKDYDTNF